MNEARFHACSCGAVYDAQAWGRLPYVGPMQDVDGSVVELRNCACGSTRSAPMLPAPADYAALPKTQPPPKGQP